MNVYLVEDCGNSLGRIYAVFANEDDALLFALQLEDGCQVVPRTVYKGQPPHWGYNP